jgi:hypothetical protein
MTELRASVEFGRDALAQLQSEGNANINPTGNPYSFHGTPGQLRDFFHQAALPKAFSDALEQAERTVRSHVNNRGMWGSLVDALAIAAGGITGHPVLSLMEDSEDVEGYPDVTVTVAQPGF